MAIHGLTFNWIFLSKPEKRSWDTKMTEIPGVPWSSFMGWGPWSSRHHEWDSAVAISNYTD